MSSRDRKDKAAAKLRKAFRPPTPSYIDLVEYLVDYHREGHSRLTRKQARQMLLDGRVMVGSHKVGRMEVERLDGKKEFVVDALLPAEKRNEIVVLAQ